MCMVYVYLWLIVFVKDRVIIGRRNRINMVIEFLVWCVLLELLIFFCERVVQLIYIYVRVNWNRN